MTLFDNLSDIPDFPESHSDVCRGVIFISNKSKYLKTEVRYLYATAVKTNIYNFKSSFMSSRHPEIVKMCRLVLYTERGRCWDYPWDWKLFNLFVFLWRIILSEGRRRNFAFRKRSLPSQTVATHPGPIECWVTGGLCFHSVTFCNFCDYFNCDLWL